MVTFEEALEIAKDIIHTVDYYTETEKAYFFTNKDIQYNLGGGEVVVMKDTGRVVTHVEYIHLMNGEKDKVVKRRRRV